MKNNIITKKEAIAIHEINGKPTMSSLRISEVTGKDHKHVIRDIKNIFNEVEIDESKFGRIYLDDLNRKQIHYLLPEREFNLVISGYSIKYRMRLIDELMSYRKGNNLVTIDKEYELRCKKLESEEILLKEQIADRRVERVKLLQEMGCNIDPISIISNGEYKSILDKDTSDALTNAYSDIRTGAKVYSATSLLAENNLEIRAVDFNNAMISAGLMEKYIFNNRTYKKFVSDTNHYGYNRDFSSIRTNPVLVKLYEDRFLDLVQMLRNEGYID